MADHKPLVSDNGVTRRAAPGDTIVVPGTLSADYVNAVSGFTINGVPFTGGGGSGSVGTFPFYKSGGAASNINLISSTFLPFYKAGGAASNIALVL